MILNFFTLHQNDFPGAHRPQPSALSPPPLALSSPPLALRPLPLALRPLPSIYLTNHKTNLQWT